MSLVGWSAPLYLVGKKCSAGYRHQARTVAPIFLKAGRSPKDGLPPLRIADRATFESSRVVKGLPLRCRSTTSEKPQPPKY